METNNVSFCCTMTAISSVYAYAPPFLHPRPHHPGHPRESNWAPCAVQRLPTGCPLSPRPRTHVNAILSTRHSLPSPRVHSRGPFCSLTCLPPVPPRSLIPGNHSCHNWDHNRITTCSPFIQLCHFENVIWIKWHIRFSPPSSAHFFGNASDALCRSNSSLCSAE